MKHLISTIVDGHLKTFNQFSDYDLYVKEINKVIEYDNKNKLFNIINLNYQEFNSKILEYLKVHVQYSNQSPNNIFHMNGDVIHLNLNRLLLNLLSSTRTYLDYNEKIMTKLGKEYLDYFKILTSKAYDKYFSYRFVYKLRNYSQHYSLPIDFIIFDNEGVESISQGSHNILIASSKSTLLAYKSWKALKEELRQLDEKIEITEHIKKYIDLLETIHKELLNKELPEIRTIALKLDSIFEKYKSLGLDLYIFSVEKEFIDINGKKNLHGTIKKVRLDLIHEILSI